VVKQVESRGCVRCYLCKCDCGKETTVRIYDLKSGDVQSCKCWHADRMSETRTKHGHTRGGNHTVTYRTWVHMRDRCFDVEDKSYKNYGGRGISVCQRWSKFENFLEDMRPSPGKGFSLDRINNDGNYEPGNCRWATKKEQTLNKRNVTLITIGGVTDSVSSWAHKLRLEQVTISRWIRNGMSPEDAFEKAILRKNAKLKTERERRVEWKVN